MYQNTFRDVIGGMYSNRRGSSATWKGDGDVEANIECVILADDSEPGSRARVVLDVRFLHHRPYHQARAVRVSYEACGYVGERNSFQKGHPVQSATPVASLISCLPL